jgi:hypothetical protein
VGVGRVTSAQPPARRRQILKPARVLALAGKLRLLVKERDRYALGLVILNKSPFLTGSKGVFLKSGRSYTIFLSKLIKL